MSWLYSGEYKITPTFAGQPLGKSQGAPVGKKPYRVNSYPGNDPTKVKAYGPGLQSGITKKPAVFTVDTKNAGKGGLGILVEGPEEPQVNCKDNKDGTATVEYTPTKPGDYVIKIAFADEPIPGTVSFRCSEAQYDSHIGIRVCIVTSRFSVQFLRIGFEDAGGVLYKNFGSYFKLLGSYFKLLDHVQIVSILCLL